MINSIIAIADIHLKPLKGIHIHEEVFNNFIEEVKKNKPDRVVIAGDLLHTKAIISSEQILLLSKFLKELADVTNIVIILGNHDLIIGSTRLDSITPIITMLNHKNIQFFKESGCYEDKFDNSFVWCVWSCAEDQKNPEINEYKKLKDPNDLKTYCGLYHGVIQDSVTDVGFIFSDHGANLDIFKPLSFFIAGDIHKYQTFKYKNDKNEETFGFYTSSILQNNFGETNMNHGYVSLQKNNNKWTYKHCELSNDYSYHSLKLSSFEELNTL